MRLIKWPPEFDGIKINRTAIFGRVKDTDIWIELDVNQLEWLEDFLTKEMYEMILAWADFLQKT